MGTLGGAAAQGADRFRPGRGAHRLRASPTACGSPISPSASRASTRRTPDKVEALILATLETARRSEGIDPETIEAAINTVEFALRENNTGSFPRGIALMFRSMGTWLYGGDPLAAAELRGAAGGAQGQARRRASGCSRTLIKTAPPRQPPPHHRAAHRRPRARRRAEAAEERARLDAAQAALDADGARRSGRADHAKLKALQEAVDSARGAGEDPDADARGSAAHQQADPDRARRRSRASRSTPTTCHQRRALSRPRLRPHGACRAAAALPADLHPRADRRPAPARKISSR